VVELVVVNKSELKPEGERRSFSTIVQVVVVAMVVKSRGGSGGYGGGSGNRQ
jgi:hypothetical protein